MKTKDLITKYEGILAKISVANAEGNWQPDMGVALDMLKHECYARNGMFGRTPKYKGIPTDFDWKEFEKDINLEESKKYVADGKKTELTSTKILVNNEVKTVKRIMYKNENYIRLRDFDDVLGICKVDYDKKKNLPIVKK